MIRRYKIIIEDRETECTIQFTFDEKIIHIDLEKMNTIENKEPQA